MSAQVTTSAHQLVTVQALWDIDTGVWIITSDEIPGMALWADSDEMIERKLGLAIPAWMPEKAGSSVRVNFGKPPFAVYNFTL